MNSIIERIIKVGLTINEESSTEEEVNAYGKLVDELYNVEEKLTKEEAMRLLRYLSDESIDFAYDINEELINIIMDSPAFPFYDDLLLLPCSKVTVYAKRGTFRLNSFKNSTTFTNGVIVAHLSDLLQSTQKLQSVDEARFLAALIDYIFNDPNRPELNSKDAKHMRTLISPFLAASDTWVYEEKEGLKILDLLDAQ